MKRILLTGLVALGLAAVAQPARANLMFEYSCSRHFCLVHTQKNRCLTFTSCATPLPCAPGYGGYAGPRMWDGFGGYGYPGYGAPVAAAPAAAAPAASTPATQPSFTPPAPKATGVQQTGYFYYGQPAASAYNYGGYLYYGQGAYQAPSYWYGN